MILNYMRELDDNARLMGQRHDHQSTTSDPSAEPPTMEPTPARARQIVWKITPVEDSPRIVNSCDSGIACMSFAELMSLDLPSLFTNDDVNQFRNRICSTLLSGEFSFF